MNAKAISKNELLDAAQEIVQTSGFEALSIRSLAKTCDISVGCIYNYFPSKAQIIFSLTERFWANIFGESACAQQEQMRFVDFIDNMYKALFDGLLGFSATFLQQMSIMNSSDKQAGRNIEQSYMVQIKRRLYEALSRDSTIAANVFSESFTMELLIDFVFGNMIMLLRTKQGSCEILHEVLCRVLYNKNDF